ncbi:polyhydroxyalkanoic acid synthase subunit PhaR [Bacillus sp. FJAT-29790]|uniref:polyhydroxyalkanoic acid synthase subunit PhaR n=1 Tax=Bacillus sp. FJAT-29790 TaxID=1895002 RepID=UPI001C247570|nr:polyhydroxyalkanoic acid synthase subunit PhaR [Bacillus sp. FJAT-29790]MBU8881226.1 polyhydroxyalkanoic acid synthase subunit PhaR [Bacillus sp. FJAT-29790]
MSNQKTFDPFSIWQDHYKNVENYWREAMGEQIKTEEFSEWMGKVLEGNLLFKQMTDKSSKQYLEQMNLPSREDLSNLSSLIVNLDTKVDDLEEKLEENLENQQSSSAVKKEMALLKKEVKEIGSKLDEALQFLKENQKSNNKSNNTKENSNK